jgi:ribosome-binding protein aMBF1 (putative translation factor)
MTQKELATKICEKPQVVNEYENGKAVPNQVSKFTISFHLPLERVNARTIYLNRQICNDETTTEVSKN